MATTYKLISSVTVGAGGASSITFSSIPGTYTDLCILSSVRNTSAGSALNMRFNSSSTGYSDKYLEGNGASASSGSNAGGGSYALAGDIASSSTTASTFANSMTYIPNYASSNYKSVSADAVTENNGTTAYTDLYASLWSNTSAITQIDMFPNANTFAQYSTFYLYGIKNS